MKESKVNANLLKEVEELRKQRDELLEALQGLMVIPAKEGSFEEKTEWMRLAMDKAEQSIKNAKQ